ncbi:hypothetical protein [Aliarcobacter butzleri]|uniref:hypothetical protein n=1 Tax=Aliarcobacter butzleri TaxID=28197 RepID=UPI003AF90040
MSANNFNIYELLVSNIGEEKAFELCEKLGGIDLTIPTKAHKTYRVRVLVNKHKEILKDENKKNRFVKMFSKELKISKSVIYKILKENEND